MSGIITGNGFKKPLNMVEGPVYPDIQATLPRFYWSKKHWTVGNEVLRNLESDTQHVLGDAILAVPRDYNETQYGKSSFKSYVNKAFRPPLINRDDVVPVNRIPVSGVTGRINPGTADIESGRGFATQTTVPSKFDVGAGLCDEDVSKNAMMRPTFYMPLYADFENTVLPDLEYTNPQVTAHSGFASRDMQRQLHALEDTILEYINPQVTVSAGASSREYFKFQDIEPDLQLNYHNPQVSANARNVYQTRVMNHDMINQPELDYHNPQVGVGAGIKMNVSRMIDNNINPDDYQQKVTGEATAQPTFRIDTITELPVDETFIHNKQHVSYQVPSQFGYKQRNNDSAPTTVREKVQVNDSYIAKGYIPHKLHNPNTKLKDVKMKMNNNFVGMMNSRIKKNRV